MNYNIKGTAVEISPEVRSYVERKLAHLDRLVQKNADARVDVELQFAHGQDKPYRAEYMLHRPKHEVLRVEAHGSALHEAIDIAQGELVRGLTESRKKDTHVLRRSALRVKEFMRGWRSRV